VKCFPLTSKIEIFNLQVSSHVGAGINTERDMAVTK